LREMVLSGGRLQHSKLNEVVLGFQSLQQP
jgi:hypothetical protein